jgi:membrane protease YdiL (CAAX protease family)
MIATPSNRRLRNFLILTYLLSWPLWIASGVLSRGDSGLYDFRWLVAQVGVFAPSLASTPSQVFDFPLLPSILTVLVAAAIILFFSPLNRRLLNPGTGQKHEKAPARWVFLSIFFFPGLFLLAWLIVNFPGKTWELSAFQGHSGGFAWILLLSFAHNFLLGGPLGEELGWRGFLLPELLKRRSPLAASLFLGLIWALWHLPVDLSGGFLLRGPAAILVRIIWTLPVAILFTWFYLKSGGNLLVVLFLHTSINVLSDPGFSKYELSLLLFFILMAISAIVVSASSRVFRRAS